ncbi:MAG TPA: hypothetical protein PLZ57_03375 [Pseudobdellovibrionaceae bacterium]|nr:hypothetical protein [Pseudobdellovibrionaceae bacterium]
MKFSNSGKLNVGVALGTLAVLGLMLGGLLLLGFTPARMLGRAPGPGDQVDQENPKLVSMFNEHLASEKTEMQALVERKIYLPQTMEAFEAHLAHLKTVETYTRYGMNSLRNRNAVEIAVTHQDGTRRQGIYTGQVWHGSTFFPIKLIRIEFQNGLAVRAWTNGVERQSLPDSHEITNWLSSLADQVRKDFIGLQGEQIKPGRLSPGEVKAKWDEPSGAASPAPSPSK